MSYQKHIVVGNVGKVQELRYTAEGIAVIGFSLACNRNLGKGDNRTQLTTWFDVTCWRQTAEYAAQHVKTGDTVLVESSTLEAQHYTTKAGAPGVSLKLTADRIERLHTDHKQPEAVADSAADMPF